jgi:hypothetical protein
MRYKKLHGLEVTMANLKDYTAQELTDELIRRLEEKKSQIKNNIEDLTDAYAASI